MCIYVTDLKPSIFYICPSIILSVLAKIRTSGIQQSMPNIKLIIPLTGLGRVKIFTESLWLAEQCQNFPGSSLFPQANACYNLIIHNSSFISFRNTSHCSWISQRRQQNSGGHQFVQTELRDADTHMGRETDLYFRKEKRKYAKAIIINQWRRLRNTKRIIKQRHVGSTTLQS